MAAVEDLGSQEHYHWMETSKAYNSDPFVYHVNRWTNWYNNSHQIVLHQSRSMIKPQPHIIVNQAYGNLMAPKIVRCLGDPNLIVRQKTMTWAVEYLRIADNRARCFQAGLLKVLMKLFSETDSYMLQQLALAFKYAAETEIGGRHMSYLGAIQGLLKMLESDDRILRGNALEALNNASSSRLAREEIVYGDKTLKFILNIINLEYDNRCLTAGLKLLTKCVRGGLDHKATSQLLEADAVITCIQLTAFSDIEVKESAARLLCLLALSKDVRKVSVERKAVAKLLELLNDNEPSIVQAAAAAALMSLTINVDAKKQLIDHQGALQIPPLIIPQDEVLCLNILQLLINVAENPHSRKELQETIPDLREIIEKSPSAVLKNWARYGIQHLLFKHRPFTWAGV
ncbi:hypothetical protein SELMODRAFT_421107 [Selaginella moellendorffii]|uniref:Condensin complex subunit 1 C-terminal domain-containing protein n=1 Tax=Selaginella moellendorffii TaxID=88036 RepID=D8SE64_SELML|nr:hypothetical protein SELMODRAFT_421107 [Selaginella moellendorffii]